MKAFTLLALGCIGLAAVSVVDARRHFMRKMTAPEKTVTVTKKPKRDGSQNVEVEFENGKSKMLEMIRNFKLDRITKTFQINNNGREEVPHERRGCFHQDKNGAAALNLCDDETVEGVINVDSGVMTKIAAHPKFRTNHTKEEEEAKGMAERRRRSTGVLHTAERVKREDDLTTDYALHFNLDEADLTRQKRQTAGPEAEVELAFVVDYKMYQHHGSVTAARDYVLSVANVIGIYYKTVTYPRITISVSSIYVFTSPSSQSWINNVLYTDGNTVESGDLLDGFSAWLASGPLEDNYDHAMLLSGLDFCSPSSGSCSTSNSGLAWVSNACSKGSSKVHASSVSEEHGGYSRLFTIAHELGHNLGAAHDGSSNSMGGPGATSCAKSEGYIMGSPKTHHAFSICSTAQFQYYFGLSKASCLYEQNAVSHEVIPSELPGASQSVDEQCRAQYGQESAKCSGKDTDVCNQLWCESGNGYCGTWGAALMGTPCPGGYCYAGDCVTSVPGEEVQDVDGGWSAWSTWGSCSASCGGGTQTRSRTCSNPYPQGNGARCSGSSTRTRTCETDECPSDPCDLGDKSVPSGCTNYNIQITYNGSPYDCNCFFKETGTRFCSHSIADYCCESKTKVCG